MTPAIASAFLPALRRLDPEQAHRLALKALAWGLVGRNARPDDPILATTLLAHPLTNPIGLAAGFDKDATAPTGLLRLGFGAVEVGTVTPRPQIGNPRPRVFRLEDGAVINRMGFNNAGIKLFLRNISRATRPTGTLIAANVGINKDGADPERDYPALVAAVAPHAAYVTLNVSSPNTPGLRGLQDEARLRSILQGVMALPDRPPIFVKIAPDLAPGALEDIVAVAVSTGVEGLIISNTTLSRPPGLGGPHIGEAGGLSGPPLLALSTAMLAQAYRLAAGRLVLIGAGGVTTGADALAKLRAGAQLVQIYAAFAVHGPALLPRIKTELAAALRREGFKSVAEAVGTGA
ncbi:quinone-dependent dihydroorotate dehydrogenase [Acidisphaera sp. L21]|uniref:quinone-dependent dihydroorotate dehydrogenase n=1 Tax=Acidisphaera sp. L21 TaxID=1641851 RepID=UPI00131BA2B9|nr:quinone-dependent dihydroorotate dehydrogenase [Acidisphaera sp. L21]